MNIDFSSITDGQISLVKAVYHKWGVIIRRAIQEELPKDSGILQKSIQFRVVAPIRSRQNITATVKLMVGILDPSSPALKYLKFVLHGTSDHFVPFVRNGKYTAIFEWAYKHGLITPGTTKRGKQVWRGKDGTIWNGLTVKHPGHNVFQEIYSRYDQSIKDDVARILEGKV